MTFIKGKSGNPAGRKPGERRLIDNLAVEMRKNAPLAVRTIVGIARNGETQALRLAAANSILDWGFGRAPVSIELTGHLELAQQGSLFGSDLLTIDEQAMMAAAWAAELERQRQRETLLLAARKDETASGTPPPVHGQDAGADDVDDFEFENTKEKEMLASALRRQMEREHGQDAGADDDFEFENAAAAEDGMPERV